jgi:catalase (peroxidase I)
LTAVVAAAKKAGVNISVLYFKVCVDLQKNDTDVHGASACCKA